jgi:hypothetical protein
MLHIRLQLWLPSLQNGNDINDINDFNGINGMPESPSHWHC